MVRALGSGDMCEFKDCKNLAENMTYNRRTEQVDKLCAYHEDVVVRYHCPEYTETCPNCSCLMGVN